MSLSKFAAVKETNFDDSSSNSCEHCSTCSELTEERQKTKIPGPVTWGPYGKPRSYVPYPYVKSEQADKENPEIISMAENSDEPNSTSSDNSWIPMGRTIYLPNTKIPAPVALGRQVNPRKYRMFFPRDNNWSFAF